MFVIIIYFSGKSNYASYGNNVANDNIVFNNSKLLRTQNQFLMNSIFLDESNAGLNVDNTFHIVSDLFLVIS